MFHARLLIDNKTIFANFPFEAFSSLYESLRSNTWNGLCMELVYEAVESSPDYKPSRTRHILGATQNGCQSAWCRDAQTLHYTMDNTLPS